MNIVLQDLCTSGHWDCGSRWLASTWKEKQRKAKIGKTPGTTNQVSCCKFQWLPSVWQMWGDSQLSIYGSSCWEIQTKGRRTCTSKVNISTFCKRLLRFFRLPEEGPMPQPAVGMRLSKWPDTEKYWFSQDGHHQIHHFYSHVDPIPGWTEFIIYKP